MVTELYMVHTYTIKKKKKLQTYFLCVTGRKNDLTHDIFFYVKACDLSFHIQIM